MKERLTGAIILVALIVLLVPELLTGPVRSAARANPVASSTEEPPLRSYTIKLADEQHPRSAAHSGPEQPAPFAPSAPSAGAVSTQPATEEPSPTPPLPAAPSAAAAHATPAAGATPEASAEGSGAYVVQLGSFASQANADRLARQVRSQGFPVSVSRSTSGRLYRVRVGPARDRATASELAQQLSAHGHSGRVVPQ